MVMRCCAKKKTSIGEKKGQSGPWLGKERRDLVGPIRKIANYGKYEGGERQRGDERRFTAKENYGIKREMLQLLFEKGKTGPPGWKVGNLVGGNLLRALTSLGTT